jgi:hypothetical protein
LPVTDAVHDFAPGWNSLFAPESLQVVSKVLVDTLILASTWQVIAVGVAPVYSFTFLANTVAMSVTF